MIAISMFSLLIKPSFYYITKVVTKEVSLETNNKISILLDVSLFDPNPDEFVLAVWEHYNQHKLNTWNIMSVQKNVCVSENPVGSTELGAHVKICMLWISLKLPWQQSIVRSDRFPRQVSLYTTWYTLVHKKMYVITFVRHGLKIVRVKFCDDWSNCVAT